jgi:rare lipoprotein A (peptidoglycan hydrolase)
MANGKPLNECELTCALPWKPDGRKYRVSNLRNGSSVVVTHTDYGPAAWTGNIIDLTPAAFRKLERLGKGKVRVKVEAL